MIKRGKLHPGKAFYYSWKRLLYSMIFSTLAFVLGVVFLCNRLSELDIFQMNVFRKVLYNTFGNRQAVVPLNSICG